VVGAATRRATSDEFRFRGPVQKTETLQKHYLLRLFKRRESVESLSFELSVVCQQLNVGAESRVGSQDRYLPTNNPSIYGRVGEAHLPAWPKLHTGLSAPEPGVQRLPLCIEDTHLDYSLIPC
jgi:hypothetical protein